MGEGPGRGRGEVRGKGEVRSKVSPAVSSTKPKKRSCPSAVGSRFLPMMRNLNGACSGKPVSVSAVWTMCCCMSVCCLDSVLP